MISLGKDQGILVATGPVVLPRVNLLPPELAAGQRLRRIKGGLGLAVVAAVVAVGVLYMAAASTVADSQSDLDAANRTQAGLQTQVAGFQAQTALFAKAAASKQVLATAMGQEVRYSQVLDRLSAGIPAGVWVTNAEWVQSDAPAAPVAAAPVAVAPGATTAAAAPAATPTAPTTPATPVAAAPAGTGTAGIGTAGIGTLTLTGVAFSHDDVAQWLESLAAQKGYADAQLKNSTAALLGTRQVVNWTASVTLTADALSGRYTKAGG